MRNFILVLVFTSLIFSSCYKEGSNYNYYSLAEPDLEIETATSSNNGFSNPYHQQIIESKLALFQLITTIVREALKNPDLNFTDLAAVRTGCPCNVFTPDAGHDGGILVMTFNNCTNDNITYNGSVTVDFNDKVGTMVSGMPDIQITQMSNLTINGYDITMGGTIDFEYQTGSFTYIYTINGGELSTEKNGIKTSFPSLTMGNFTLSTNIAGDPNANPDADPNGNDMLLDPSTFVDNQFLISIDDALATCTNVNTGDASSFCVDTSDDINLLPQFCSCPRDGTLRIINNNQNCGTTVSDENSTRYDFGDGTCTRDLTLTRYEFLSYEGFITGAAGPANGITSIDVGVVESDPGTAIGESLQLKGNGSFATDFTWTNPTTASPGSLNTGQTLISNANSTKPWINEFHYDNDGGDMGEFIEIAGPAGFDLTGYQIRGYNGSNGQPYSTGTVSLSGSIDNESNGFGAVSFPPSSSFQNGSNDGLALVDNNGAVVEYCVKITESLEFCE